MPETILQILLLTFPGLWVSLIINFHEMNHIQMGVLTPASRERAIEQAMALESEDFNLEQMKWVILMVLFNQPGEEAAYAWVEDLVFDTMASGLH